MSALPRPAHGFSRDTYQDARSPHHDSGNGCDCSASEPSRDAEPHAAEVPAAVLADLLNLTPGTATRWTRHAAGDWSRYAAELTGERSYQR